MATVDLREECKSWRRVAEKLEDERAALIRRVERLAAVVSDLLDNEACSCRRLPMTACPRCQVSIDEGREALKEEPDSHPPGTMPEKDAAGNILAKPWARRERY